MATKLHINQNLTLQDVIKLYPSATVLDIEDLIQGTLMEIWDYRMEIEQNECRIKTLEDALGAYADELNWERHDDCNPSRLWIEPDSSTPQQYNGFELAQKTLKGYKE